MEIGDYVDEADLDMKIDSLPRPSGGTDIYTALVTMRRMFQADHRFDGKPDKRFIAIVITDGEDARYTQVQSEASAAHDDGISIISIGKTDAAQVRSSSMFKVVSQLTLLIDNSSYNNLVQLPIRHASNPLNNEHVICYCDLISLPSYPNANSSYNKFVLQKTTYIKTSPSTYVVIVGQI